MLCDVLLEICEHVGNDTVSDPGSRRLALFINLYSRETPIAGIARTLGVSRPTVYRMMPAAFNLVAEEIERYTTLQGVTVRYTNVLTRAFRVSYTILDGSAVQSNFLDEAVAPRPCVTHYHGPP